MTCHPEPVKSLRTQHRMVPMIPCANMGLGCHHGPQLQQGHGPRHSQQQQLRSRCCHDPDGSTDHLDQYGTAGSMALGHQHGLHLLTSPWAFAELSVVTGAMVTAQDPTHCRAINTDMALGSGPCSESPRPQEAVLATLISKALAVAQSLITHNHTLRPRPRASSWP